MIIIKDCPFCGDAEVEIGEEGVEYYVGCNECGCKGGNADTVMEAIDAWNRRAPAVSVQAIPEFLKPQAA